MDNISDKLLTSSLTEIFIQSTNTGQEYFPDKWKEVWCPLIQKWR